MKISQFITGPEDKFGNKKIVNLKNVSNIAFEHYTNRDGDLEYKIIFNFNYFVSLRNNYQKHIPDYTYFITEDKKVYDAYVDTLDTLINSYNWIAPLIDGRVSRIANPDCIGFISTDPRKNRIILNLNTSVSFYNNVDRITSDFIYLDFKDPEEYKENLEYIKGQLETEL